jgi:hypothetical protein
VAIPAAIKEPPEAVAAAITALGKCESARLESLPASGARVQRAILESADRIAHRAATEKLTLDTRPIEAARNAEQTDRDATVLLKAVKTAAVVRVCNAVDEHAGQLLAALGARHGELMREFALLAKDLPPGVNDTMALKAGEPMRSKYLSARDTHAEAMQLREAVKLVDNPPLRSRDSPGDLERALWNVRDAPELFSNPRRWHGGSFDDFVGYVHNGGAQFWLPTFAEVQERAAELREEHRRDTSRLPDRPSGVPTFR